jgi:hypothetical protein
VLGKVSVLFANKTESIQLSVALDCIVSCGPFSKLFSHAKACTVLNTLLKIFTAVALSIGAAFFTSKSLLDFLHCEAKIATKLRKLIKMTILNLERVFTA